MKKVLAGFVVMAVSLALGVSTSFAKADDYAEGTAGKGSIAGTVTLKGAPMAPIMEDLNKGKNAEFCTQHPDTKEGGIRPRVKVVANGGKLKGAVVFIEEIDSGKPWGDAGKMNFDFTLCDIVQKIGAVRKTPKKGFEGMVTITNNDTDILHNPHGYSVVGANRKTLFNKPLPSKGDVADVGKDLKRFKEGKDQHFFLQCDQHNYMEADAWIVYNPYYAVTGDDGSFKIDGIPAGKYKVTAWHPYVGESTQEITVGDAAASANYELTAK